MFNTEYDRNEATFANFLLDMFGLLFGILGQIASSLMGSINTDFIVEEQDQSNSISMFDSFMDLFESSFGTEFAFISIDHHGNEMIGGMIDDSPVQWH